MTEWWESSTFIFFSNIVNCSKDRFIMKVLQEKEKFPTLFSTLRKTNLGPNSLAIHEQICSYILQNFLLLKVCKFVIGLYTWRINREYS